MVAPVCFHPLYNSTKKLLGLGLGLSSKLQSERRRTYLAFLRISLRIANSIFSLDPFSKLLLERQSTVISNSMKVQDSTGFDSTGFVWPLILLLVYFDLLKA